MSGIPLTALLPEFGSATRRAVERWVAAALAHAAALREYDHWLYPKDPARQAAAEHLHQAWGRWADDAEAVLHHAETLTTGDAEVTGLANLRDEIGYCRAMLKMTPALIARRREQVERGEVYSMEEVRRELRAGSRG